MKATPPFPSDVVQQRNNAFRHCRRPASSYINKPYSSAHCRWTCRQEATLLTNTVSLGKHTFDTSRLAFEARDVGVCCRKPLHLVWPLERMGCRSGEQKGNQHKEGRAMNRTE